MLYDAHAHTVPDDLPVASCLLRGCRLISLAPSAQQTLIREPSPRFLVVALGIGGDNKFTLIRDVIHKHTGLTPAPQLPPPSIHAYGKVMGLCWPNFKHCGHSNIAHTS